MRTLGTGRICSVSPLTYNGRGRDTCLALRHRFRKKRDIRFEDNRIIIIFDEFEINRAKTVAMVASQTFSEVRSLKVPC